VITLLNILNRLKDESFYDLPRQILISRVYHSLIPPIVSHVTTVVYAKRWLRYSYLVSSQGSHNVSCSASSFFLQ